MSLVSLRSLLDDAAEHTYAVPAFNVNTLDQAHAVMRAARAEAAPAILQLTTVARQFFGDLVIAGIIGGLQEMYPDVPLCVHQDHAFDLDTCETAIAAGFNSVMIDASLTPDLSKPSTLEDNIARTLVATLYAHARKVSVEGALGVVGSLESCISRSEEGEIVPTQLARSDLITDVQAAATLVEATGIDALAIAVGTSHGMHKFDDTGGQADIELDAISAIHDRIPNVHLVMHGCSTVPQDLQDIVNRYGGKIPLASGLPLRLLEQAVQRGVRKINIDTDGRMAMTAGVREFLAKHPQEVDPRAYLSAGAKALTRLCTDRYQMLGASGAGERINAQNTRTRFN